MSKMELEGKPDTIRIAGVIRESIVDGPGIRFTVFCQGCPHGCPGCHNPATHDFSGGYDCQIEKIIKAVDENPMLDGITFSGGEPFCQPEAFLEIAKKIKERKDRNLNIVAYTGFTYEELIELGKKKIAILELLQLTDLLIDGKFIEAKRDLTLQFRGSQNQRIIDMARTRTEGKVILSEKYI